MVVSIMVPCTEESWKAILPKVEETGCDGIELNFGCPHGMSERGMGAAVGQVPEYIEMVARWCKMHTRMPVIVKLTPNITDIRRPARAAKDGELGCLNGSALGDGIDWIMRKIPCKLEQFIFCIPPFVSIERGVTICPHPFASSSSPLRIFLI